MTTLAVCVIALSVLVGLLAWQVYSLTNALRRLTKKHRRLYKRASNAYDVLGKDIDALETTVEAHRKTASQLFVRQGEINAYLEARIAAGENGGKVVKGPWR